MTPSTTRTRGGDSMRECRDLLGAQRPRALVRLTRRMSLLVGALAMFVLFGVAQAASAATLVSVTPNEACPGEVVTFTGKGFATKGRPNVKWSDKTGIQEQFGPVGTDKGIPEELVTDSLGTKISTTNKAVVPLFFQLWEGPTGLHKNG